MRIGRSVAVVAALCFFAAAERIEFPPVPPLPNAGWPSADVADAFARALIARVPPAAFDDAARANPDLVPAVFRNLGTALLSHDTQLQTAVKRYATALVREHAARIPRNFSNDDLHMLVAYQVLDPLRYGEDEEFRRAVDTILPASLNPSLPEPLRRADINELNRVAPINFDTAEALAISAGLVRPSGSRFVANRAVTITTGGNEPIEASIYSINSRFVKPDEAKRFLTEVRAAAPQRSVVVIGDETIRSALRNDFTALHIDFVDNLNRPLTPWPRDPFSIAAADGRVVFINRPNEQRNREEDAPMVRVLLNGLPKTLDDHWKPHWTTGATSFHNGQILLTPKAVWVSMHSVEFRALELLGIDHVPVERFGSADGIAQYNDAVQRAANELSKLYNRPVRFVHELPHTPRQIEVLGGGAGFDLDSIVTLLPQADGSVVALVGDVSVGAKLAASANEWQELEKTYSLAANSRDAVLKFRSDASSIGLQDFLDQCANDLAARGVKVRRLPLLMIPTSLLIDDDRPETPYFLVGWNNVVLEGKRAEGFASGLPLVDAAARSIFKSAGYDLTLFPSLPRSVVLNGGYRCASNEVRRGK